MALVPVRLSCFIFSSVLLASTVSAAETHHPSAAVHHPPPAHENNRSQTEDYGEKLRKAVGVNFPGVNGRIFFTPKVAGELKFQYLSKVFVAGGRFYYYPDIIGFKDRRFRAFTGLEADYLSVKGELSEGNGFAAEIFGGVEYFFHRDFSFQLDFGPAYITVSDHSTSLSSDGLQFVFNTGVNYYF